MNKNTLYLVSTPIGNYEDITLRALNILKESDVVVCEEYKEARRLLSKYEIQKELISLNEHNEDESSREVIQLIKDGKKIALISDCGTPLFSDPGHTLVDMAIQANITISPVPGASSLLPALTGSNFDIEKFYYYGWLSPKKEIRKKELLNLKKRNDLLVIMETPYRLKQLLGDVSKVFGSKTQIVLAYKLTQPEEIFYRGEIGSILKTVTDQKLKGEFVLLVNNRKIGRNNKN
ncbi:MAG: 16S rRNA (cytidine(1402)-2'-O)-methyltransferase [Rhodothermaceae bacterium]